MSCSQRFNWQTRENGILSSFLELELITRTKMPIQAFRPERFRTYGMLMYDIISS